MITAGIMHRRTRHGVGGLHPPPIFSSPNSNFRGKIKQVMVRQNPLNDFRASNGENIWAKRLQPPPPLNKNWSRTPIWQCELLFVSPPPPPRQTTQKKLSWYACPFFRFSVVCVCACVRACVCVHVCMSALSFFGCTGVWVWETCVMRM